MYFPFQTSTTLENVPFCEKQMPNIIDVFNFSQVENCKYNVQLWILICHQHEHCKLFIIKLQIIFAGVNKLCVLLSVFGYTNNYLNNYNEVVKYFQDFKIFLHSFHFFIFSKYFSWIFIMNIGIFSMIKHD